MMIAKRVLTIGLLLFVAASLAAWAARELRRPAAPASPALGGDPAAGKTVIAYYFHRTERCDTCNTMEAYSHEALATGFAAELADGRIEWRVVNYQTPENEHFRDDFHLVAPSLVLVAVDHGRRVGFRELTDIWTKVGEKGAFVEYVQRETKAFLEGLGIRD